MIPVKIQCGCGQRYAFDVEPVNGQMGSRVACPVCGADGTEAANRVIAQTLTVQQNVAPGPPPLPAMGRPGPEAARGRAVAPATMVTRAPSKAKGEFNLGLGTLGAFLGAAVGVGLMYGFYEWAGFRFPLLGVGIGVLTGFGARLLFKGTDHALGVISGAVALASVVGTLYLMYGTFPIVSIISVVVSVSMAYRIAA